MICHEKDAQNIVNRVKRFIICSKCPNSSETHYKGMRFLLEAQNSNNSEFGCF